MHKVCYSDSSYIKKNESTKLFTAKQTIATYDLSQYDIDIHKERRWSINHDRPLLCARRSLLLHKKSQKNAPSIMNTNLIFNPRLAY